jgi:hypothetical protein
MFIRIAHALTLVGLGRPDAADLSRRLPDALPVGALDHDLGLAWRLDADAFGYVEAHRVREAERQVQRLASHGGTESDTDQLEFLLVAARHAEHHVGNMRARRAGAHARLAHALVTDRELLVFLLHRDAGRHRQTQGPLGALDGDRLGADRDSHACRNVDDFLCHSGHVQYSVCRAAVRRRCK